MADLSFHRKYRPTSLKGYIGNKKVKESLLKTLSGGNRPQVLMFYGDSGCGKTTLARITAREYLCEDRDDTTGSCGVCANCVAMDEYIRTGSTDNLPNVTEVNVASDSGKRDLDRIVEDMQIPSFEWKVYILDECHKASEAAQNLLLKIVEEPPENILIIFCTTEPDKMLDTLRNRCQIQYHITKPTVKELADLSKSICKIEDVEYDMKGLEFIANRAECTIRSNLQYLQRVITEQGDATYGSATKVFEEVSNVMIVKFFRALKNGDVLGYVTLLNEIKMKMSLDVFLNELRAFVMRGIYTVNGIILDGVSDGDLVTYKELFGDLGIKKVSFLLQKLLSLSTSNLEMELLVLGYSGLEQQEQESTGYHDIPPLESECVAEQGQANKVIKEKEKKKSEQNIANADALVEEVDMDAILQFGGILIDD